MINFAAIMPHPTVAIPGLNDSQTSLLQKTISAMKKLAEELKKSQPQTVIIVSPHGPMRYDKFIINLEETLKGNFSNFGIFDQEAHFINDTDLAREAIAILKRKQLPIDICREKNLDYGTLIPLHYLFSQLERKPKIVPLTFTAMDWDMHYAFGKAMGMAAQNADYNVAIIASGDLSHRLSEDAPAGFSPYGAKFDKTLTDLLIAGNTERILNLNPEFCSEASECGLRSIIIALGAISQLNHKFQQLSYESPMGVGHLVGRWKL